jgi:3-dehydroquinate dehydratase-2
MKKIMVINGPNLNLLGQREPEKYGELTLLDLESRLTSKFQDILFTFKQSNIEGEIINFIHQAAKEGFKGILINPGGFSHTSVAILDAIKSVDVPVVEVHLTNLCKREDFRQKFITGSGCLGVIQGGGFSSYTSGVYLLLDNILS